MEKKKKQNKVLRFIRDDAWIIALDILAVNAAYFFALIIRGSVFRSFQELIQEYIGEYFKFAPIYTVLCLLVFFIFRLYGGMWRYAGIIDMNRIVLANIVTCIIQVVGTLVFVYRMPITYYGLGALFQFLFITVIRFGYRIVVLERRKLSRKRADALIVGSMDEAHFLLRVLESGFVYRPVGIVDGENKGRAMDGLPIYRTLPEALDKEEDVNCVFLADMDLAPERREEIQSICRERHIVFKDYTGFFSYSDENDTFSEILDAARGPKHGQHSIPFSPPDIGDSEIEEVAETMRSGWITTGPRTKVLERKLAAYIETGSNDFDTERDIDRWKERVVCLNSATAAEELNLRILGIGPGDEVIVPALTYTASASAVIHCGATVKFVDIQADGATVTGAPEMDYDQLEKAITPATKPIVTVDIGWTVCDYDRVFEIVKRKKPLFTPLEPNGTGLGDLSARIQKSIGRVAVVADCAHSLGASRIVDGEKKYCGTIADFSSFSFHAVKNLTTAEGGASTWNPIEGVQNSEIYKYYQLLSLHGQNKDALAKTKAGAWEYDIIGPWYKCNMTDIMAAIGLRQLNRYAGFLKRRLQIVQKYDNACDELGLLHLIHHSEIMDSSKHLYIVRVPGISVEKRNLIIEKMALSGVSTNVHYKPLPMMTAYKAYGWDIKDFPNAYAYYENLFTLPLHTLLSDKDVDYICETLKNVIKEVTE